MQCDDDGGVLDAGVTDEAEEMHFGVRRWTESSGASCSKIIRLDWIKS